MPKPSAFERAWRYEQASRKPTPVDLTDREFRGILDDIRKALAREAESKNDPSLCMSDAHRLRWCIGHYSRPGTRGQVAKDLRERHAALQASVREDGKAYIEERGRDCDGVQYSGRIHKIEPTLAAFDALHDKIGQWADGPFRLGIIPAGEELPQLTERDLVLEAFEDGHPHVIYPTPGF